jgi:hypothetical protein
MQVDPLTVWGGIKGGRVPLAVWSDTWPTCFKSPLDKGMIDTPWRTIPQSYPREPHNRYDFEKMLWEAQDYPVPLHAVAIPCPNRTASAPFDNRTCPPNGVVPALHVKYVHQSNCDTNARNTITVTFSSNVPLARQCQHPCLGQAEITLSGLSGYSMPWATGSLTPPIEYLSKKPDGEEGRFAWAASLVPNELNPVTGTRLTATKSPYVQLYDLNASGAAGPTGLFGQGAAMDPTTGNLVFSIRGCNVMIPGKNYSLNFTIMNGPSAQESPPDIHFEVSGAQMNSGYETGLSVAAGDHTGRHLGAACYAISGSCYNIRLATHVYIDKPNGIPDGGHAPLLIVHPGEFANWKLTFGSCRTDNAQYACGKEPAVSARGASSFAKERDAELIIDFRLGLKSSNTWWVDIHNNTKGNYTSIRSKRYIWLKFPITIQPTGDKITFSVEGRTEGSKLKQYPYKGMANCSDGQQRGEDPAHGAPGAYYSCRNFDKPA